uniref:Mitochondrial import receptor subunit TOM22 homolog n=1 Tax=Timema shepardi TaxID=629360 RepID=A0A7R9ANM8_TIMSH|nr:unnamed protein product [Timema shepardi]
MASLVLTDSSQLTADGFEKLPDQIMYPYAEPYELQKHLKRVVERNNIATTYLSCNLDVTGANKQSRVHRRQFCHCSPDCAWTSPRLQSSLGTNTACSAYLSFDRAPSPIGEDIDSGMESLTTSSKDLTPEKIKRDDDEDDLDDEDLNETLSERLWGLSEMFPENVRNVTHKVFSGTCTGVKGVYNFSCMATWLFFSTSVILFAPLIFEIERAQMEEAQRSQQKQIWSHYPCQDWCPKFSPSGGTETPSEILFLYARASDTYHKDGRFPEAVRLMTGVQWLKLDRTNLSQIPEELGKLLKIVKLTELTCLRTLNIRHNRVKTSGIPAELFRLEELTTLDLSHNNMKEVPEGLERAHSLLVLNLSHNHSHNTLRSLLVLNLSHNQYVYYPLQLIQYFALASCAQYVSVEDPRTPGSIPDAPSFVCEAVGLEWSQLSLTKTNEELLELNKYWLWSIKLRLTVGRVVFLIT